MDRRAGFGVLLDGTFKRIKTHYSDAFKTEGIPITPEQWTILEIIDNLGEKASQKEVSNLSYRNKTTTSRIIDGLVKKELIERTRFKGDLKRVRLLLTKDGERLVAKTSPIVKRLRDIGYKNISENDFDIFIEVLKRLQVNYSQSTK